MVCGTTQDKKLVIIAGASRGIGKAFLDEYKKQENVVAVGMPGQAGELAKHS